MRALLPRSLALLASVLLVFGGCADPEPVVPTGAWSAEIVAAQGRASTELQRRILHDGVITEVEYREAVDAYVGCMRDQGVDMTTHLIDGLFQYRVAGTGDDEADSRLYDSADAACGPVTKRDIEMLYGNMLISPNKEPLPLLQVQCMQDRGLVDPSMTWQEFDKLLAQYSADRSISSVDFEDPEVRTCMDVQKLAASRK